MKHAKLVEDAKRAPARIYSDPSDVLRDRRLSDENRVEILNCWERGARALGEGSDEAMSRGKPTPLRAVVEARKAAERRLGMAHDEPEASAGKS